MRGSSKFGAELERDMEGGSESTGMATGTSESARDNTDDAAVMASGAEGSDTGVTAPATRPEARWARPVAPLLVKRVERWPSDVDGYRAYRHGSYRKNDIEGCTRRI